MRLLYSHSTGLLASIPPADDVAAYVVRAFGHLLNTPERRNQVHTAAQFAQVIEEHTLGQNDQGHPAHPRSAAIVRHLRTL